MKNLIMKQKMNIIKKRKYSFTDEDFEFNKKSKNDEKEK